MEDKTMVMKMLDAKKIKYQAYSYDLPAETPGVEIAKALNENPKQVFKTLVTVGKTGKNYIFVIPVAEELDLKKAAKVVNEKKIDMLKSKDLLATTGYIHGGCSPIGLKKNFPIYINESIKEFDTIMFSAGKVGHQVQVALVDLPKIIRFNYADLI